MFSRRFLLTAVGIIGITGICLSIYPLIASLKPNARSYAELPRIPIPDLGAPGYGYFNYSESQDLLFVRDESGETRAFWLMKNHKHRFLHDYRNFTLGSPCNEFGLNANKDRLVCIENPNSWGTQFALDGTSLTEGQDGLVVAKGKVEGDDYVLLAER